MNWRQVSTAVFILVFSIGGNSVIFGAPAYVVLDVTLGGFLGVVCSWLACTMWERVP